ncbi:MAG: prepilin-type N-terminal cleavage/methylation domain-containing protein [Gammaproteobacteria bacterium]|nr:MAG: prepilin-type N-terminal cleavage/methylation domain-containing protein [Gammaproteobacteria bacterium]
MQKHESAFTLIELMITITVAAVVLTLGVPGFGRVIERNQLSAYTNQLVSSLHFARSEAVRRNQSIKVCHSDNSTDCNGSGYENSWIIFIDDDGDDVVDAGEELIRVNENLPSNYTFNVNGGMDSFSFNAKGRSDNQGTFVLCKNSDLTKARAIIIGPGGRTRLAPLNSSGVPEQSLGTPVASC